MDLECEGVGPGRNNSMLLERGEMEPEQAKITTEKYKWRLESCPGERQDIYLT